jgi:peroxiredoxin
MRHFVLGVATCIFSFPALAALEPGAIAPDFKAKAAIAGKEFTFSLEEALQSGPVVVYFYPAAFTGGCNIQAHTFATNIGKFSMAGASIIGVSLDKISTLKKFSADPEYCGGKVPVASDPDGHIAKSYGLEVAAAKPGAKNTQGDEIGHGFAERTTFIVTQDGKISALIGGVSPKENVEKALESVQQIRAGESPEAKPATG